MIGLFQAFVQRCGEIIPVSVLMAGEERTVVNVSITCYMIYRLMELLPPGEYY